MIILNNVDEIYEHDQTDYLYAIADIYRKYSSEDTPLKDTDVVQKLSEHYNLHDVDRHIIKKYRDKLSKCGYVFFKYENKDGSPNRKGWYLSYIDGSLDDDELIGLCYLIKANKSYYNRSNDVLLETLSTLISNDKKRDLVKEIQKIHTSVNKSKGSLYLSNNLTKLTSAIKQKRPVKLEVIRDKGVEDYRGLFVDVEYYPQFIFVKNEQFFIFCNHYIPDEDKIDSYEVLVELDKIVSVHFTKNWKQDTHQNTEDCYTQYIDGKAINHKISEIIDSSYEFDSIYEHMLNLRRIHAKFVATNNSFGLPYLLHSLQFKFGDCCKIHKNPKIKSSYNEDENIFEPGEILATIEFDLPESKIIDIAYKCSSLLRLVEPENLIDELSSYLESINENFKKTYGN